jgi:hypothetical protein
MCWHSFSPPFCILSRTILEKSEYQTNQPCKKAAKGRAKQPQTLLSTISGGTTGNLPQPLVVFKCIIYDFHFVNVNHKQYLNQFDSNHLQRGSWKAGVGVENKVLKMAPQEAAKIGLVRARNDLLSVRNDSLRVETCLVRPRNGSLCVHNGLVRGHNELLCARNGSVRLRNESVQLHNPPPAWSSKRFDNFPCW